MGIRERALAYLIQVPPLPGEVDSHTPVVPQGHNLFWRLCGITHKELLDNWAAGGNRTSCNSFCGGPYAAGIGISPHLGRFGLEAFMKQQKKTHAWIPAIAGARPKIGDVFEIKGRLHQGISLDFTGSTWNTVEGGQGGPTTKYDIIKRRQHLQTSTSMTHLDGMKRVEAVAGWVDIDLYLNGPAAVVLTMPDWLPGWWSVPWRGQIFYYYFETPSKVRWTYKKPVSDFFVPVTFDDTASVTFDTPDSMTLKWNATGSVEKFRKTAADGQTMQGDWNTSEPLTAKRCFYNPMTI